jgi:large subunit ribosomal protein L7Ae
MEELSKENVDKALEAVELARSTGKIKKGTNEVTKAVERGEAKLVLVAKDVNPPEITMHIKPLCDEKSIPCVIVPSREELGGSAGLEVATVAVVIVQEGEAKKTLQELLPAIK